MAEDVSRSQNDESWFRLSITYDAPSDEKPDGYFFEQEVYALMFAWGCTTVNEQDAGTLDGKDLPEGKKRILCFLDKSQATQAVELRAAIEQSARNCAFPVSTEIEVFSDQSWKDGWKACFVPAQVSPRIAIRTPWSEFTPAEGVQVVIIEPGMAFGTGLHETTQMCIQAIDEISAKTHVESMLDVGCGSGVLSIAGCKCGISHVHGVDNDPVCIDVSRDNAEVNQVNAVFDETDIWDIEEKFDLVVANIISSVLMALKEDMKAACKPGATLVLSGILATEIEEVESAFLEGIPMKPVQRVFNGEWCSLRFVRT